MTTPAPQDFSFNVVAGTNTMVATWVLNGPAASASVVSAELIVNDISMNPNVAANGYRSFMATPAQVTARAIEVSGLNGVRYSVRLFVTADGVRYMTTMKDVIPQSVPQAPVISCEGTTNSIVISIDNFPSGLNEINGFSEILGYEVFYNNAYKSFSASSSLTLVAIDGVANGTDYEVAVRAKNQNGVSPFSSTKVVRPTDRPLNVSAMEAVAADRSVVLNWTPPSGMTADSEYRIQVKLGAGAYEPETALSKMVPAVAASQGVPAVPESARVSETYTALVNGSSYSFRIRVYNPVTLKFSEFLERTAIPYGRPNAPKSVVDVSNNRIQIKLSKPDIENGRPVTDYILNRVLDGVETPVQSVSNDASGNPIYVIQNLVNGTQYSFNSYALNALSPESKSVVGVITATPYGAPGAVTGLAAVGLDQEVRLTWVAPANAGGADVLSYRISYRYVSTAAVGTVGTVGYIAEVYTDVVETTNDLFKNLTTGLVNGTLIEFNVVAFFTRTIEYLGASSPVSCRPFKKADKIAANAVVMTTNDRISYSWAQPALHGLPFVRYMYKALLASNTQPQLTQWVNLATNSEIVSPLVFGQQHKLLLKTITMNGSVEVESDETEVLYTPYKKPDPVRNLQVYAKNLSLDVVWDPPASSGFGGYPSLRYNVTIDNIANFAPTANEKVTIYDLSDKTSYLISVVALGYLNDEPQKVSDIVSASGAPHGTPDKPTGFRAVPEKSTSVTLSWVAPVGYAQTPVKYVIFRNGDRIVDDYTSTTYPDTGLERGVSHKYKVMTKQVWGDSFVSYSDFTDELTATPYNNPAPVQNLAALVSDKAMDITWNPLSTADKNGIIGTVYYDIVVSHLEGSTKVVDKTANQTGTSVGFTGLVNGTLYTVEVKAEIYNSEIAEDVQSTVASMEATVNMKPAAPREVVFTPSSGKINVAWFGAATDGYNLRNYQISVDDVITTSMLDVKSGTKNSLDLQLPNGTSYTVKMRRVGRISGSNIDYFSDWTSSQSLMPFGAPILTSGAINSLDRKKLDFVIQPNGSQITKIVALIVTDKYASTDEVFKQVTVSNLATSGSISETVSFNIAQGTNITSFLAIVVNANGLVTVYPTPV